jgi:hypothetical protein
MTAIERPYGNLSKKDLVRILDHVPEEDVRFAMIYEKILKSRELNPGRLWERNYRPLLVNRFPQHKVEWCLDTVDLIGRALMFEPGRKLAGGEIEKLAEISGIFDKKYVDPEVRKLYDSSSNWIDEKSYQDQIHRRYVGPVDLRRLVEDDSHFDRDDLRNLIFTMETAGYLVEGGFNTYHLTKRK